MSKQYIVINLNKAERAGTRIERVKERGRGIVFGIILALFIGANTRVVMISLGYNSILDKKKKEISRLKDEINNLKSQGKNLSKYDILSLSLIHI